MGNRTGTLGSDRAGAESTKNVRIKTAARHVGPTPGVRSSTVNAPRVWRTTVVTRPRVRTRGAGEARWGPSPPEPVTLLQATCRWHNTTPPSSHAPRPVAANSPRGKQQPAKPPPPPPPPKTTSMSPCAGNNPSRWVPRYCNWKSVLSSLYCLH